MAVKSKSPALRVVVDSVTNSPQQEASSLQSRMDNINLLAGSHYGSDGSVDVLEAFILAEDTGLSAAWVSSFFFGVTALLGLDLLA
jgi:hypothetical protein